MLLSIHPETPQKRHIRTIVNLLKEGSVIIYPTDSVYALGCDIYNTTAVDKLAKIKGVKLKKADFSFIFENISMIANYTKPISNEVFKLLKKNTPGPHTFILEAGSEIPQIFRRNKKTLGTRIPKNNITDAIVKELGHPILTTSLRNDDEIVEYMSDPDRIYEEYGKLVDAVIDGGYGKYSASTIVDCTKKSIEIIREGAVELNR
ncbi:MAG: L-threonylcarbamoyladenylate synthase [Bacteroidota bacterium]|nr:L-threonylcarbamoyladenylate synthase [Bacteroidota bacterium]